MRIMGHRGAAMVSLVSLALLAGPAPVVAAITADLYVSGLDTPLFATAPAGDPRLFVVEREGRIRIVEQGVARPAPFLDIHTAVSTGDERGLLGLAFSPSFASDAAFYVYYTNPAGDSVVSRFLVSARDPNQADAESEVPLLTVAQPAGNHNGGTVAISPVDGLLYFSPGDGGDAYDPLERAQDPAQLLGKMLRIDPAGAAPVEIWASGLRNPYRFSFDRETGDLWIADVGQRLREEIDFEPAGDPGGRNYGWDVMEGSLCNATDPAPSPSCNAPSLTLPVHEYEHTQGNCSITGGFLYRGVIQELRGHFVFGDYCSSRIWSFDPATGLATDRSDELGDAAGAPLELVGFGEDGHGELYVVHSGGDVYRIRSPSYPCSDGLDNDGDLRVDYPDDVGCRDRAYVREDPACSDGVDNGDPDDLVDFDGGLFVLGPGHPDLTAPDPQCGVPWKSREGGRCGLGWELALVMAPLTWQRRRRRPPFRRRHDEGREAACRGSRGRCARGRGSR